MPDVTEIDTEIAALILEREAIRARNRAIAKRLRALRMAHKRAASPNAKVSRLFKDAVSRNPAR